MNRRLLPALVALLALAGCRRAHEGPPAAALPPAIQVVRGTVDARPMPRTLPLTGSLVANQQSEVAANASGRVVRTFVERGAYVQAGAALAQLDAKGVALSEAEARANLKNALSQAQLASSECARNQALFQKGAISKEEWERTSSQCETSAGSAEAARARAALAQKSLTDATVRAPFAGMVGERYVSVGEYVQPPTKVVSLVELDPLRLQLTVDEANVGQIHEGQKVQFEVEAFPGRRFEGVVKYIDPTVRTSTRDLVVEAVVKNPDHTLKPGMFATAFLELADEPVPSVPRSALKEEANLAHLFAIVDGRVEERIVQPGPERDGYVAILDGAKAGEQVVVQLNDQVRDGVPVK